MLGLLALGLTAVMIYTLVKNALLGKQLSKDDSFNGTIELIIPMTPKSEFFLEAWQNSLSSFSQLSSQLKVHVLVDGHHPTLNAWHELQSKIPFLEIHSFPMRPNHVEAVPWMLEQMSSKIQSEIVIIGDAELVPNQHAFLSAARTVSDKKRPYFVVPQTAKFNKLGEAITTLNPTLAFTSYFGTRKWRRNFTHPLISISQGWMIMDFQTFKEIDFKSARISTWKEFISRQWHEQKKTYQLAFGEKNLVRHYPEDLKTLVYQLRDRWEELFRRKDKMGVLLFIITLFIWSFPIVCLYSHPFWSIASFFLLVLYRFFSKIVFQESWRSIMLHPIACLFWIGTLVWFGSDWISGKIQGKA